MCLAGARVWNAARPRSAFISVEQVLRMKEDKAFPWDAAAADFGYSPVGFEEGVAGEIAEYLDSRGVSKKSG